MADKEIGGVAVATALAGTEQFIILQGGNSRRLDVNTMAAYGAPLVTDATTARVLSAADRGRWIQFSNAGAITVTFNTGIFAAGDEIAFEQIGAGVITFTAGAGFTLNSAGGLIASNGAFTTQAVKFKSATQATLYGNLA